MRSKVLLVENDRDQGSLVARMLQEIDPEIELDHVSSGEQAIERIAQAHRCFKKRPYQLIVTDLFLRGKVTGIDFWEICQNIYPNIPAVFLEKNIRDSEYKATLEEALKL